MPQDYEIIANTINNPDFNQFLYQGWRPVNTDDVAKQIESENSIKSVQYAQCLLSNDRIVGWCGLHAIGRDIERVMELRSFIIPDYWGKGYGTEQHALLVKIGFEHLNLHRIQLGTHEKNKGVLKIYEKLGFVKEGVFREEYYRNGKYSNTDRYGVLRSEYDENVKNLCNSYLV